MKSDLFQSCGTVEFSRFAGILCAALSQPHLLGFEFRCVKAMAPHSSTLPGKSHGWRSLVGRSPWGRYVFILSEVIPPFFSSSVLGTYRPGEFIFQCHTFLPFHTVHGVLKARILKWCAIPFSVLSELSTILGGPTWQDS